MFAWRLTMFVFFDRGPEGVERLTVNRYGSGDLHREFADYYKPAWMPEDIDPWQRLAQIIRMRNPKKIALDESDTFAMADGLTATNKALLVRALGPEYSKRLVSAERLVVGWFERRTAEELNFYPQIVALNHQVVSEAFSRKAITPGVTTIDDLAWWVRDRIADLKLGTWFQPMFYIIRPRSAAAKDPRTIQPGDLLTSSTLTGRAMKAKPVFYAGVALYPPGAIIGKALAAFDGGSGVISVLVMLH
jgi:hypothetical protein